MDIQALRKLTNKELEIRLSEKRSELMDVQYEITSGKSNETTKRRELRVEIARILTLLNNESDVSQHKVEQSEESKETK